MTPHKNVFMHMYANISVCVYMCLYIIVRNFGIEATAVVFVVDVTSWAGGRQTPFHVLYNGVNTYTRSESKSAARLADR